MKEQVKYFNRISKIINPIDFYNISIWESGINYQGHYKSLKALKYSKLRFTQSVDVNGYITMQRGNISITLTD